MIDWLIAAIPVFKVVHIAALVIWIAGLLALPLMLARHDPAVTAEHCRLVRHASHRTYTLCVTPAAVIAVIAETWLIFLRETYVPWFFDKLAFVALLVVSHAWIGHILAKVAEEPKYSKPVRPVLPVAAVMVPAVMIVTIVLAKPPLAWVEFLDWLLEPRGGQFPFDVPNR